MRAPICWNTNVLAELCAKELQMHTVLVSKSVSEAVKLLTYNVFV